MTRPNKFGIASVVCFLIEMPLGYWATNRVIWILVGWLAVGLGIYAAVTGRKWWLLVPLLVFLYGFLLWELGRQTVAS